MPLEALIKAQIKKQGPLTISEYMQLALYHPQYGYYMVRDPLGQQGDFTTAPEISQIFGELLGAWVADAWEKLGSPTLHLIEIGPGRGSLMQDILRATRNIAEFQERVHIHMVEISPWLKDAQRSRLDGRHPSIHWHDSLPECDAPMIVIGNEFLDALPVDQFIRTASGVSERCVGLDEDDQLAFIDVLRPDREDEPSLPMDTIIEYSPAMMEFTATLSRQLHRHGGAALFVDYGYQTAVYGDTLQAMRSHQYHPVLHAPGTADLTTHVNFLSLARQAGECGLYSYGPVTQQAFLLRLGLRQRLAQLCARATPAQQQALQLGAERLISDEAMGQLFKVIALSDAPYALAGF